MLCDAGMPSRALVLPHYELPDMWRLKYLALLFDHIAIPNPKDEAVVNAFDWEERPAKKFGVGSVIPAAQMPFLRDPDYAERYQELLTQLGPISHRGTIEVLPSKPLSKEDSRMLLRFVGDTISNAALVEAAVPDRTINPPPFKIPNHSTNVPFDMDLEWVGVRQATPKITQLGTPQKVPNVDEAWSNVAWLRLGAAAKFLRKACQMNAVPTALDDATSRLLLAIASGAGSPIARPQQQEMALAWDILNPHKLRAHLDDMNWRDVIDLRRELLPAFGRIRSEVQRRIEGLGPTQATDLQQYRSALAVLHKDFADLQARELEAMRSASLKGLFTAGSTVTSVAVVVAGAWPILAYLLAGGAAVGGGITSSDLQKWFLAWKGKRNHVMYPIFSLEQEAQATG